MVINLINSCVDRIEILRDYEPDSKKLAHIQAIYDHQWEIKEKRDYLHAKGCQAPKKSDSIEDLF